MSLASLFNHHSKNPSSRHLHRLSYRLIVVLGILLVTTALTACASMEVGKAQKLPPTPTPTETPTPEPTEEPTEAATSEPTEEATGEPEEAATPEPTEEAAGEPAAEPEESPTSEPTEESAESTASEAQADTDDSPRVFFEQPVDNAVVPSTFPVMMAVEGLTVEPSGEVRDDAGHLHILVDTDFIPAGEVIPNDEQHLHFGDGALETELELEPGSHILRLQFADGEHTALEGEQYRDEITITVEE